jgi:hypothetical protein
MPLDAPVTIAKGLVLFFAVLFFVAILFLRGSEQVRPFDFLHLRKSLKRFLATANDAPKACRNKRLRS